MNIPAKITAGDSISWDDLPASDNLGNEVSSASWTLKYDIRQTDVALSLTASAQGSGWRTSLTAVQSAQLKDGPAFWQAYATNGSSRVTLGQGKIEILPNIAASDSDFDGRLQCEKDLEAVQAAMRALISGGAVQEYTIGGRSLRKIPMADLIILEQKLKRDVVKARKAERIAAGLGNPDSVFVRFKG